MTPEQIDRVFGCGRLQMVTGKHVEVFREAAVAGTRRRYTKRFLHTLEADFGQWTEREWRILARLIGHGIACVPDVVQYDRGAAGGTQLVQTYDAGVTVDQWATILPVMRNGRTLHHVFEDCAHWWALAHHCLHALQAIHELSVVHLDIKGDNVCIPFGPPGFDPHGADLHIFPRFGELALIDFAFALVSRESLPAALPIGWQTDYDYQSPRLLHALEAGRNGDLQPTRQLDWRCDMYSLAAMLKRYLPDDEVVNDPAQAGGWSATHVQAAKELILALREAHDGEATLRQPHARLLELTITRLADADMRTSLAAGWALARDANVTPVATSPATPVTRLAPPLRVIVTPRVTIEPRERPVVVRRRPPLPLAPLPLSLPQQPLQSQPKPHSQPQPQSQRTRRGRLLAAAALALVVTGVLAMATPDLIDRRTTIGAFGRTMLNAALASIERVRGRAQPPAAATAEAEPQASPTDTAKAGRVDTPTSRADAAGGGRGDAANTGQADKPPPNRDAAQSAPRGALASKADTDDAAQTDVSAAKASPSEVAPNAAPASETDAGDAAQQTAEASASPSTATGPGPAKGGEPTPPWRVSKTRSAKATTPTAPATPALAPPPVAVAARPKTSSGAKFAEGPSRPAKIASAPPRPNVAAGAKIPPTIASATAPKRIRFFDDDPTRSATTTVALAPITTRGTLNSEKAAPPLGPVVEAAAPVAAAVAKPAPVPAASAAVTMPAQDSLSTPPPAAPPAQIAPAPTPGLQTAPAAREPRDLLSLLRDLTSRRDRGKAPIEDRTVASVPVPRPSAAPSVPPKAPDGMGSENRAPAAAAAAPNPSGLRSPSAAPGDNARPPVTVPSATDAPAFALTPPDDARTSVARPPAPQSRPIPRELAPRVAPPGALAARDTYGSEADATDLAAQARRTLAESVPYSAARAQGEVARVLRVAANAGHPAQEHNIVEAVRRGWPNYQIATSAANIWPASARQLHEEARRAYAGQRNVGQAFDLQLRAFGANPHDAEVAGNLAFLYLKTNPMQPETARQLSLHAIALRAAQMRPGLVDDWSTLAVASALTGREMDATNALYVAVALSPDLDRNCKVMLGTVDRYGDVMSGPVQAMMSRIRQYGRDRESPYCVWPPINSRTARAY